ncbi:MAG: hypothetical protein V3V20_10140 [Algisphaera sp.]
MRLRHTPLLRFVCLIAAWATVTSPAVAGEDNPGTYATPAAVSNAWAYDLTLATPRAISVESRWYWYMPYKVINKTGADRLFVPEITVTNDHGEIVIAGRRIAPAVFNAVADRLANPLLESPDDVVGTLLQGQDFAKESVAIWPVSPLDIDTFTVFFAGADGEVRALISPRTGEPVTQAATDPVTGEALMDDQGQPLRRPVLVQRNRAFTFATPGTTDNPEHQTVQPVREWAVMR